MRAGKIRKIMEYFLWGEKTRKYSLRQQMARVITICCILTVTVQTVVMLAMSAQCRGEPHGNMEEKTFGENPVFTYPLPDDMDTVIKIVLKK